jgi:hypothetical protein
MPPNWAGTTQHEYDKKARELKGRQAKVAARIDQHQQADDDYRATPESLISLVSRAAELFKRSKTDQKRQLFPNLRLRGKTQEYSLRSLVDLDGQPLFELAGILEYRSNGTI